MALTNARKRFCEEYLIDLNAKRAYMRVFPKVKESTAEVNSCKLLQLPEVQEYLEVRMKELQEKTGITQERVLNELAVIAFSDLADFIKIDPAGIVKAKNLEDIPEDKRRAIETVYDGKVGHVVQLHHKVKALELLGKHLGMFTEKVDLSAKVDTGLLSGILDQLKE